MTGGLWVTTLQDKSLCDSVCPKLASASQRVSRALSSSLRPECTCLPRAHVTKGPEGPSPDSDC